MTVWMFRKMFAFGGALAALCAPACACAQTHKVGKPETVVRALGVYEWTGDLAKPAASRLIPVTVFIDGKLEDAGVYLARPVPFALLSGNLYELQEAGVSKGGLELAYARHLQSVDTATGATAFDDGWFGYGSFKAALTPKKASGLKASTQLSEVKSSGTRSAGDNKGPADDGRPHFGKKPADSGADEDGKGAPGKTGAATPDDADRPTMRRRSGSGNDAGRDTAKTSGTAGDPGASASGTPAEDPDRPHLSKRPAADSSDQTVQGDTSAANSGAGTASPPPTTASGGSADDSDRPTLKRRSADDIKKDKKKEGQASVSGVGSLNADPDRPNLHRGKPTSAMTEDDLPKLKGLPADVHQMVAVSDAANRPVHEFARPWNDEAERAAILKKMEALALAKLATYATQPGAPATTSVAPVSRAPAGNPARRASSHRTPAAAPVVALQDEVLKGYTLSYGGAATYVFTAHTAGAGGAPEYVTEVAQADAMGELKPAIESVTDAAHLDRTPRMRLVDAVDAEANNRASLLFELRGQRSRQFGLYSVIGARADQRFLTGTTQ